jgi:hypothetical protein
MFGLLVTIIIGVGWYEAGEGAGWIGSILGAFILLWIYNRFKARPAAA